MEERPEVRRFWEADRLHDEGLAIQRQNLRRRHPGASDEELDRLLAEWLRDRPPDAPGRLVDPETRVPL